jgi:hypothetical protein
MDNSRELQIAARDEREIDSQSLEERKEAQAEFLAAMRTTPELVGERIAWLLSGHYGAGSMLMAKQATKRMNRSAMFTQLVAVFEWRCPRRMAVDAWKKLSRDEKSILQMHIDAAISEHDASELEEITSDFAYQNKPALITYRDIPLAHVDAHQGWVWNGHTLTNNIPIAVIHATVAAIKDSPKKASAETVLKHIVSRLAQ